MGTKLHLFEVEEEEKVDGADMKLDKYKNRFLKIVLDFLIADYSSWKVLEILIFKRKQKKYRSKLNVISAGLK